MDPDVPLNLLREAPMIAEAERCEPQGKMKAWDFWHWTRTKEATERRRLRENMLRGVAKHMDGLNKTSPMLPRKGFLKWQGLEICIDEGVRDSEFQTMTYGLLYPWVDDVRWCPEFPMDWIQQCGVQEYIKTISRWLPSIVESNTVGQQQLVMTHSPEFIIVDCRDGSVCRVSERVLGQVNVVERRYGVNEAYPRWLLYIDPDLKMKKHPLLWEEEEEDEDEEEEEDEDEDEEEEEEEDEEEDEDEEEEEDEDEDEEEEEDEDEDEEEEEEEQGELPYESQYWCQRWIEMLVDQAESQEEKQKPVYGGLGCPLEKTPGWRSASATSYGCHTVRG
ncbi:hypothetical protein B0T26DRAFT_311002 [Lasiosphaeria miniovina]|uniref:Uncharacterized protein n=1 Tax=Lasiosphaeria miniovina TaxID=1954250 RepID=A0AA40DY85_9PEZI|nr:uncharacterized protein B0T26DRAFT_311002 [Lasiosphaeria miniovina]KAK0718057.1 hypothetical protein B0T26DRAFT_311002 [Lasiosphaeria miniovina]